MPCWKGYNLQLRSGDCCIIRQQTFRPAAHAQRRAETMGIYLQRTTYANRRLTPTGYSATVKQNTKLQHLFKAPGSLHAKTAAGDSMQNKQVPCTCTTSANLFYRGSSKCKTHLRSLDDAGGQQLLSDVLILEQNRVVLHVGPNTQNVLHLRNIGRNSG